jgi:hypothetical protein
MSDLSVHEAAAVFAALDPSLKRNPEGHYRGPATYRGGDNPTALSIDTSKGGRFYDHVAGQGGDTIDYVRAHLGTDFKGACRVISAITGRDLAGKPQPQRRRFSPDMLAKARRFRIGITWRLERHLELLKEELWGPRQAEVAPAVRSLTAWRSEIDQWSDYKSASVMTQLSRRIPKIVDAAIAEAAEAERQLADAIAGVFREGSAAA